MDVSFDYQLPTRIVFGPGKIGSLGKLARQLEARRALVVSDPGVVAAGHVRRGVAVLQREGIETRVFAGVHENPTTADVDAGLEIARQFEPDLLVGLGGGSAIDSAKGINFVYTNGGSIRDYWGVDKARRPMLPMIGVPTTAGTGSEVQSFALIADRDTRVKMACGDKKAACRVALLDPELTLTQPPRVTALGGIDALAHAVETYVTRARNPVSLAFSREAWRRLAAGFARVLHQPGNLEARGEMQLGACFAGLAIESSMLGAAHALANPLTADYGIAHGQAVGVTLPHVVRFNGVACSAWYGELLQTAAGRGGCPDPQRGAEGLAEFIAALVAKAGLPSRLSDCGVDEGDLGRLAAGAAAQWTGQFNPRKVAESDFQEIYRQAF